MMDSAVDGGPDGDLNPQPGGVDRGVGQKRPVENGEEAEAAVREAKKPKLREDMKRVAEIVLVLSAMGQMRGGKSPTKVELGLMAEARAKLAEMCQEFAPKDIVGRDAVGAVIEDLGLNGKLKDQRLGFRAPKLTISEKLSLAKRKMEESKKYMAPSMSFTSNSPQQSVSQGSASHTIRMISSDKQGHATVSSGSFMTSSASGHVTTASNAASTHQYPVNGYKGPMISAAPMGSGHYTRDPSTLALPRVDRPHFRSDAASMPIGVSQARGYTSPNHTVMNPQTWSAQPQSGMLTRAAAENKAPYQNPSNVSQMGQAARDQSFRPHMTQTAPGNIQGTNQPVQGVNVVGTLSGNNHAEIAKIVEKFLQPRMSHQPTWTPPSREYMNKVLACQMCRVTINEVDTVLICDACEKGFHLKCLQSNNLKSIPKFEWHCPRCLQLSHGKPLPPKYGRVMRNTSTKAPANTTGAQMTAEKKVGNPDPKVNPQKTDPRPNTGSHGGYSSSTVGSNLVSVSNSEASNFRETPPNSVTNKTVEDQRTSDTYLTNNTKPIEAVPSSAPSSSEKPNQQISEVAEQPPQPEKHVTGSEGLK